MRKNILLKVLACVLYLVLSSHVFASAYAVRIIQAGESLGEIAERYGISVDALMQFNGLESAILHPGDEVMIPYLEATGGAAETEQALPPGFIAHTLQPGESLATLSELYGVVTEDVIGANPNLSSLDRLPAGIELLVPPEPGLVVTLEPGERIQDLMAEYGLNALELMNANGFASPRDIRPGVMVFLPGVPPTRALERLAQVRQAENRYIWPLHGRITSYYGRRNMGMGTAGFHQAIDVSAPSGTPVVAARSGTVSEAGWSERGYGNLIKIAHADGDETWYAHQSEIYVTAGVYVNQGDTIGLVGSTGLSTGPHLHFEVHENGEPIDPLTHLQ